MKTNLLLAIAASLSLPLTVLADPPQANPGGIMIQNGAAYIVQPLSSAMPMPDGSKVQPNGTIVERDGTTRPLDPGQMLTLDGQVKQAPFGSAQATPISGSTSGFLPIGGDPGKLFAPASGTFPGISDSFPASSGFEGSFGQPSR